MSYVGVIVALLAMRTDELHAQRKAEREPGLVRAGLRYVWSSQALRVPLVVMLLVYLFTFNFSVVIPLHAVQDVRRLGDGDRLVLRRARAGGVPRCDRDGEPSDRNRRSRRLAGFSVAFGVFLGVAGLAPTFMLALISMVPVGYVSMLFAITANSTLQQFTRADMRGRVMALYTTIFLGSTAIGGPITGWVAETWDAPATFVASGAVAVGAGLFALRARGTATASTTRGRLRQILLLDPRDLAAFDREPPRHVRAAVVGRVGLEDRLEPRVDVPRLQLAALASTGMYSTSTSSARGKVRSRVLSFTM